MTASIIMNGDKSEPKRKFLVKPQGHRACFVHHHLCDCPLTDVTKTSTWAAQRTICSPSAKWEKKKLKKREKDNNKNKEHAVLLAYGMSRYSCSSRHDVPTTPPCVQSRIIWYLV